jgi:protein SCO1/2
MMKLKFIFTLFLFIKVPLTLAESISDTSIYNVNSSWTSQDNKTVKLTDFKGKIIVTSMIYMGCKSSCPLTVAKMKEVEKLISADVKSKVHFVLFSFDLKNDTPEAFQKYAKKNHLSLDQWTFLTNKDESNVREISTLIDFKYKSLPSGEFEHSFALVALDKEGRIIGRTEGSEMNPKTFSDLINKEGTKP